MSSPTPSPACPRTTASAASCSPAPGPRSAPAWTRASSAATSRTARAWSRRAPLRSRRSATAARPVIAAVNGPGARGRLRAGAALRPARRRRRGHLRLPGAAAGDPAQLRRGPGGPARDGRAGALPHRPGHRRRARRSGSGSSARSRRATSSPARSSSPTRIAALPRKAVLETKRRTLLERRHLWGFLFDEEQRVFRRALLGEEEAEATARPPEASDDGETSSSRLRPDVVSQRRDDQHRDRDRDGDERRGRGAGPTRRGGSRSSTPPAGGRERRARGARAGARSGRARRADPELRGEAGAVEPEDVGLGHQREHGRRRSPRRSRPRRAFSWIPFEKPGRRSAGQPHRAAGDEPGDAGHRVQREHQRVAGEDGASRRRRRTPCPGMKSDVGSGSTAWRRRTPRTAGSGR